MINVLIAHTYTVHSEALCTRLDKLEAWIVLSSLFGLGWWHVCVLCGLRELSYKIRAVKEIKLTKPRDCGYYK